MRRYLSLCLALTLLLTACAPAAEETSEAGLTAAEIALALVESQADGEELGLCSREDTEFWITELYGLPAEAWTDGAIYTAAGADAREIGVVRLADGADQTTAASGLEEYRLGREGDFFGYAPDQSALAAGGVVTVSQGWAVLLICSDTDSALEVLETCLTGGAVPVAAEEPSLETEGFIHFDPPNEYDMSLYDTSAILLSWESGERDGLSEKDAAILDKCEEIFAAEITEDMTDFEKELALHDWLVTHGSYDWTAYDREPNADGQWGQLDNTNPYGMLVGGYGICLGYATTFQLLMELAGVECITVVGAAFHSREDHAWNMVRLDGEWYCVDPTWNCPNVDLEGCDLEELAPVLHPYFNLTSREMRESDHQWDYETVPEATATRYYWDGTGERPAG